MNKRTLLLLVAGISLSMVSAHITKTAPGETTSYFSRFTSYFSSLFQRGSSSLQHNVTAFRLALNQQKNYGYAAMQGKRKTMEDDYNILCKGDTCLYGLYDGHGSVNPDHMRIIDAITQYLPILAKIDHRYNGSPGARCAQFAAKNLNNEIFNKLGSQITPEQALSESYNKISDEFKKDTKNDSIGTTAVTALINPTDIVVANVGDSRAVLYSDNKTTALSKDHKPDNIAEEERIEKKSLEIVGHAEGRIVSKGGIKRVQGKRGFIAITRALGDREYEPHVISDPEIMTHKRTNQDQFLILACDGVWDVMSNTQATDFVSNHLITKKSSPQQAAKALINDAYSKGSTDNISAIVIDLRKKESSQ